MKEMTKTEFLGLFKKYAKAVNKAEVIPFKAIKQRLTRYDCPFRSRDGYYWEVSKSGKPVVMRLRSNPKFQEACTFFNDNKKAMVLRREMLSIVEGFLGKN